MKIIFEKQDLLEGLNIVIRAVPIKSTMPLLECIVIEAVDHLIKFTSNNMELGINRIVKGTITQEGSVALNARFFSEIIRKLSDDLVSIETDEKYNATIQCGQFVLEIAGKSAAEYPKIPVIEKNDAVFLSQLSLKDMIRQTVFSIADNESRNVMTGELFDLANNELSIVSLDGYRLSIRKLKLKQDFGVKRAIVPGRTLIEISKILSDRFEDGVSVYITDKHILFEFEDTTVLSRTIVGEFYPVEKMISSDYSTKVIVNRRKLLESIDRANLVIRESEKKPIVISVLKHFMKLNVKSSLGNMYENIDIIREGNDITIAFNPKYLGDVLKAIDDEEISIYISSAKAPCIIRDEDRTYTYLISPVAFNSDEY